MSDQNEWLTTKEAMAIARVTYYVLRSYIKSGALKATKPGGKVLIHRDDLKAFFERGRILPKQSA